MSSEGQAEKKRLSLAKAFEALQAGPIYQVRVSPPPATKPLSAILPNSRRTQNAKQLNDSSSGAKLEQEIKSAVVTSDVELDAKNSQSKKQSSKGQKSNKNVTDVPEDERCRRSDGKEWRCKNRRVDGLSFCMKHASRFKREAIEAGILPPPPGGMKPFRGGKRGSKKAKEKKELAVDVGAKDGGKAGKEGVSTRRRRLDDDVDDEEELHSGGSPGVIRPTLVDHGSQTEDFEDGKEDDDSAKKALESPIKLLWTPGSFASWQVQLALEENGLAYDSIKFDASASEVAEPFSGEFSFSLHKVPALIIGNVAISEASAITEYIGLVARKSETLFPKEYPLLAEVLQRVHEGKHLETALVGILSLQSEKDAENGRLEEAKEVLRAQLKHWDQVLEGKEFVAGDKFSLADVSLFPALAISALTGLKFEDSGFHALQRYHTCLMERESVQKTMSLHDVDTLPSELLAEL